MLEIAAAVVGSLAVVAGAVLGQPARRATVIHRYVALLNDLPSESVQRNRLAAEIDRMVDAEIDARRYWATVRFTFAIVGFASLASVFAEVALRSGGVWWFYAILCSIAALSLLAVPIYFAVRWLWRRLLTHRSGKAKRSKPKA
jgi:hypothetical protein